MINHSLRNLNRSTPKIAYSVLLLLVIGAIPPCSLLRAATPTPLSRFRVQDQWNLGGAGGWSSLVLDPATKRLYIPRTDHIMVVDTETGKLVGNVEGMKNIREIALDDSGRYGYVTDLTDGSAGFVRVFDRSSFNLIASIPTGAVPNAIVFDPSSELVFAFNSRGHSATVIDAATNQVTATIPLDGRPGSAIGDGHGAIFVALPALGEITRIDAAAKKVAVSWQLAPCTGPSGLAIDSARRQLFTACEDHKLVTVNAETGHATPIGDAPNSSGDIDFDSSHNLLFVADASGSITIFHRDSPTKFSTLQKIPTQPGTRTMIVNPRENRAYLAASKFGQNTGAVSEELRFRPTPIPNTFSVIVVGR